MKLRTYVDTAVTVAKLERSRRRRLVSLPDPPAVPPGARTGPPDYVGIGVQKAGTTWWNGLLRAHPDNESRYKELRFFQVDWNGDFSHRQVERYHSYFPRTEGSISGEWTPNYLTQPWSLQRLHQAAPDTTLLLLLRDPVARLRSGLRHHAFRVWGSLDINSICNAIDTGLYAHHLKNFLRFFSHEQTMVLQFERCLADPKGELARTYERLGLDPNFKPPNIDDPVNTAQGPEVPLSADFIESVRELYLEDVKSLAAEWPEIDFDLWPSVRGAI